MLQLAQFRGQIYKYFLWTSEPPRRSKLLRSLRSDACKPKKKNIKKRYVKWGKNYVRERGGGEWFQNKINTPGIFNKDIITGHSKVFFLSKFHYDSQLYRYDLSLLMIG